jgi:hypothetical protein
MDSTTPVSQYLPSELLDNIFSHFTTSHDGKPSNDDTNTLLDACLASRRICEIAQPHLYATIHLDFLSSKTGLLQRTLEDRPHLQLAVKELRMDRQQYPKPRDWKDNATAYTQPFALFFQNILPLLTNLAVFRSDHHDYTTKLIASFLFKEGSGYHMDLPTDFGHLRSLELVAYDSIFKYNYILRLPRLERVFLHSIEVLFYDDEDAGLPNDWGWTSQSIKELILRPTDLNPCRRPQPLFRENSLSALSRSLPLLEALTIERFTITSNRNRCRSLAAFFTPQIEDHLRPLKIYDGGVDAITQNRTFPRNRPSAGTIAFFQSVKASRLEHLAIDIYVFFYCTVEGSLPDFSIPKSIRQLTLRYLEDTSRNEITTILDNWESAAVVQHARHSYPLLQEIHLELDLAGVRQADNTILQRYKREFHDVGIDFHFLVHEKELLRSWRPSRSAYPRPSTATR